MRGCLFYGNGTSIRYDYDQRQRLRFLNNTFSGGSITKEYSYDELSNITNIAILSNNYLIEFSGQGNLGGTVEYSYKYDNYNRLVGSRGFYIGPNDFPNEQPTLLRQQYDLEMQYDDKHNILNKNQYHRQTEVTGLSATPNPWQTHQKTSYDLNYEDYATGGHSSGDYSYVQPHAPRKITETPVDINDPLESQIKVQKIDYDADGNMTSIQQKIKDPDNPLTEEVLTLRKHRWDEEDRLRGVDLMPDNEAKMPEISSYTYDASGERVVRYVPSRLDAFYNAQNTGFSDRLESFVYPSGLVTLKTVSLKNIHDFSDFDSKLISTYTKHYYISTSLNTGIGSERISSALGTIDNLGALCADIFHPEVTDQSFMVAMIQTADQKVVQAAQSLQDDYNYFEKQLNLPSPFLYNEDFAKCRRTHHPERYAAYWFHPDHLGSSSYISNLSGEISQHLEYLPFGETLVEEHKNSNNSPYKFNAKELDDETGNYYYGARYYNPKWSFWLNVDPLAEEFPSWSPYSFSFNNPIRFVDPDGRAPLDVVGDPSGKVIAVFYHGGPTGGGKQTTVSNAGYTGNIYTSTQSAAANSGRDFTGTIIAPGVTSASGVSTGLDFINQNYEAGDQVIIYGYSYGVDVAVDLTHSLNEAGINVDLLVTVDGSDGPLRNLTVNTTIPENVGTNLNVYQTSNSGASSSSRSTGSSSGSTSSSSGSNSSGSSNRSNSGSSNSPGSKGGPNKAVNSNSTNVINKNMSGPGVNHGNIQQKAESTIQPLINTRILNN